MEAQQPDDAYVQQLQAKQIGNENEKDLRVQVSAQENLVTVALNPPEGTRRNPISVVCVIDISGSMAAEASIKNEKGDKEMFGLTVLDVVKHSVKTIIANLSSQDSLSIVSYDDKATVEYDLQKMTPDNKKAVDTVLDSLHDRGSTNLWDGLHCGLEVIKKHYDASVNQSVFLFTDGQPNVIPPRGHIPMLQKYKDENPNVQCMINTFGFGFNMDSNLLNDIAIEGSGFYSYIPDSGFVGTIFVNAISNVQSMFAKNVKVSISPLNGALLADETTQVLLLGGQPYSKTTWGLQFNAGFVNYGQPREFVVRMKEIPDNGQPFVQVVVEYENLETKQKSINDQEHGNRVGTLQNTLSYYRLEFCSRVQKAWAAFKTNQADAKVIIDEYIKEVEERAPLDSKFIKDLLQDTKGQVKEAVSSSEYFNKWGYHFLPSIRFAHLLQICNNFKDPGVQNYGGKMFRNIRDMVEASFTKIPPPKPSKKPEKNVVYQPVNMSRFNNANIGCFSGESRVQMHNGTTKLVKDLRRGDVVVSSSGKPATIRCVVNTDCSTEQTVEVVKIGQLVITPYHPVFLKNNQWVFPCQVAPIERMFVKEVCSFLLEEEHTMMVEGVACIGWGHGFKAPIAAHDFFGTEKVVKDLSTKVGWESGYIQLGAGSVIRDEQTKLVIGLKQEVLVQ